MSDQEDRKQLLLMNVTSFFNMYVDNHRSSGGIKNVRLSTLETTFANIYPGSQEYKQVLERMENLMADAPTDSNHWSICVWVMQNGSLCPLISQISVGAEEVPISILSNVIAIANNQYVAAFEVTFNDNPTQKWLFVA